MPLQALIVRKMSTNACLILAKMEVDAATAIMDTLVAVYQDTWASTANWTWPFVRQVKLY